MSDVEMETCAVPGTASAAATVARSCVPLTKVVGNAMPFHSACIVFVKFVPLIVRVNPCPEVTVLGERLVNAGAGKTVKVAVFDVDCPGFCTMMAKAPKVVGAVKVSDPELTNAVGTAEPFTSTWDPFTKLLPVTVMVGAGDRTVTGEGATLTMLGAKTVNGRLLLDTAPFG